MRTPVPQITIWSADEYRRVLKRLAELRSARRDSIDQAVFEGLLRAALEWRRGQVAVPQPGYRVS